MPYPIKTKQLKTAWKRSGSELSFRAFSKQHGPELVNEWLLTLRENLKDSWEAMVEKTGYEVTPKVTKLTGVS